MKEFDYQAFYDRVGSANGWDFSTVQCEVDGLGLDLYGEVMKKTGASTVLLDIGTGGGEAVLSISGSVLLAVGIDRSSGMIETAQRNLRQKQVSNVRFLLMDAEHLVFPDGFFDVISCRHADFNAQEVYRVLRPGGIFMTQQVSEGDKWNIKNHFGRGQSFAVPRNALQDRYIRELREAGFCDVQWVHTDVTEYYARPEDLLFLLKHTPILPDFGELHGDFALFDSFIRANQRDRGIATNAARFMIVAGK
jgi:SAM-dependent methyltransferase